MPAPLVKLKPASLLLIALVFAPGCSKKTPDPQTTPDLQAAAQETTQPQDRPEFAFTESLPHRGTQGYAGSKACLDCHREEHASWHRTYHRTMTQVASRASVQADFNNVILTNDNTRFTLFQKPRSPDEYWVRMEPIAGEGVGSGVETRIGLITGSHHMQVFWVPEGHGNLQIGFPFTWLIPEQRWVPRNSAFIRPPETEHRPEAWNIVCSRCHATGVEPHFNAATQSVDTQVGELGIACEACHGPGQRHFDLRKSAAVTSAKARLEAGEIVHPEKLSPERASQICGFCHSMKWIDQGENWLAGGFKFRPGDDLEKTTPIIRKATIGAIPGLQEYLVKHPSLMSDFFWSDGMVRVSGREYNGLLDSPCYKEKKFSCLSCHSGHPAEADDMLSERGRSATACTQCHEQFRSPAQVMAHSRHRSDSAGSDCYNCHLPHTTYGVLKAIRSHQVSSPRVRDDLSTGRPNACNLCHLDKTLAWTADYLKEWHGQEKPPLPEQSTNISHAVRLALAGDAGQRALVAWHLGWAPALQVSGTNWVAPILGQLLDDPYAAVRCVAERSLRSTGFPLPANFDFTAAPGQSPRALEIVWERWRATYDPSTKSNLKMLVLEPASFAAQKTAFESWLAWRDHRPIRLRE